MKNSDSVSSDPSIIGIDSSILIWTFSSLSVNYMARKQVLHKAFQTAERRPYYVYEKIAVIPF